MSWQRGQPYRVVRSLDTLNVQIRAYAPRSVPPRTDPNAWGSIADDAHSMSSDHYPHFYAALGGTAVVCARDFPHAPGLGLDGGVVTEALRISRDNRIQYVIFNRRITGVNYGWQWRRYTGTDPHDTHFHVSTVHDARADDIRPWTLPGPVTAPVPKTPVLREDDDMGQSWPPIEIRLDGFTSVPMPPVEGGDADPRPAWITVMNDVWLPDPVEDAPPIVWRGYGLRLWWSKGDQVWAPLSTPQDGGLVALKSGQIWGQRLPSGMRVLSALRMPVGPDGVVQPLGTSPLMASVYGGHLALCIERGKVMN